MKNGHGGKRHGAGRKPVEPNKVDRLAIGMRCEELRKTNARQVAIANSEPRISERDRRMVAYIQKQRSERAAVLERLQREGASPLTIKALSDEAERYEAHARKQIGEPIEPKRDARGLFDESNFRRERMSRQEIMNRVSEERGGKATGITPRRVKAFWTEYKHFARASGRT